MRNMLLEVASNIRKYKEGGIQINKIIQRKLYLLDFLAKARKTSSLYSYSWPRHHNRLEIHTLIWLLAGPKVTPIVNCSGT